MFQWTSEIDLKDFMQETHSSKDFSKNDKKLIFTLAIKVLIFSKFRSKIILISYLIYYCKFENVDCRRYWKSVLTINGVCAEFDPSFIIMDYEAKKNRSSKSFDIDLENKYEKIFI